MAKSTLSRALMAAILTVLVLVTAPAYAQDAASASAPTKSSDPCQGAGRRYRPDDFVEIGLRWDHHYPLIAPSRFDTLYANAGYVSIAYGWSSCTGKSMVALTLNSGDYSAHGSTKSGDQFSKGVPLFMPGVMIGQFLGRRLLLTEGLSLPLSENGPGAQLDIAPTLIIGDWFALRAGINTGFYRTGLPDGDGKANIWGIGSEFELIFVPWGLYRKERSGR